MDPSNADNAQPNRGAAKKFDRLRKRLRRSAQRNRNAIEGAPCVLGLLIGVAFGVVVSREAPAGHLIEQGHAGTGSLP